MIAAPVFFSPEEWVSPPAGWARSGIQQGKRYDLPHVLLYSVLAVASGATSYRKIEQFLQAHWQSLNEAFGSRWKRAPAYTGLRKILQGLDAAELEAALTRAAFGLTRCPFGAMPDYMRIQIGADYRVRLDLPDGRKVYARLPYSEAAAGQPVRGQDITSTPDAAKPATEERAA